MVASFAALFYAFKNDFWMFDEDKAASPKAINYVIRLNNPITVEGEYWKSISDDVFRLHFINQDPQPYRRYGEVNTTYAHEKMFDVVINEVPGYITELRLLNIDPEGDKAWGDRKISAERLYNTEVLQRGEFNHPTSYITNEAITNQETFPLSIVVVHKTRGRRYRNKIDYATIKLSKPTHIDIKPKSVTVHVTGDVSKIDYDNNSKWNDYWGTEPTGEFRDAHGQGKV